MSISPVFAFLFLQILLVPAQLVYNGGVPFLNPDTHSMGGKTSSGNLSAAARVARGRHAVMVRHYGKNYFKLAALGLDGPLWKPAPKRAVGPKRIAA